jgi:hypothetical protein
MLTALAGLGLLVSLASPTQAAMLERLVDQDGALDKNDQVRDGGQWADIFPVDLQPGDRLLVELEGSKKLDTFLVVKAPSGAVYENDDAGSSNVSAIDLFAEEGGTWIVYASSYGTAQKGKYNIRISKAAGDGTAPPQQAQGGGQPAQVDVGQLSLGQPSNGRLEAGDAQLDNGEWFDAYEVQLQAGQQIAVEMSSDGLDTYVGVRSPSGDVNGNDDWEGSRTRSRVEWVVEETGTWVVLATTYAADESGSYTVLVEPVTGASDAGGSAQASDGAERWSGMLGEPDDTVISSGEWMDPRFVDGQAGERWIIDLRSSSFDPFLVLRTPEEEQIINDDFEGANDRSLIDYTLPVDGQYIIGVTTYRAGESGNYDLSLRRVSSEQAAPSASADAITSTLGSGDEQLDNGEWYEIYPIQGLPGQPLRVEMRGGFDTYVGILGPGDFKAENDDGPDGSGHSLIETVLPEAGEYIVIASSYAAAQGGEYTLEISAGQASQEQAGQRDVMQLVSGSPASGTLSAGDMTLDAGEYSDVFVFDAVQGQGIVVSVGSTDFDPYMALMFPDETIVQNDDWEGSSQLSRVEVVAPQTGRYRLMATSYRPAATGTYTVQVDLGPAADVTSYAQHTGVGETYGVFVGISDYPDDGPSDLDMTREDAEYLYTGMQNAGMDPNNGVLLTDSQATVDAMVSAVRDLGSRMSDDDRLVLFYSGHGGRVEHTGGFQAADPDGFDETLALYDAQITDDALAAVLDEIEHGTVLVVFDSCFSGGFSKDLISRPHRMGLFSSHEDVTSAVADKFRAGGYLAHFMVEAIGERRADEDHDGALTALELSQYLYERYRSDVKSMPQDKSGAYDDIVMTGRNLGYQQIIVDRGGVGPSQILFAW